MKKIALENPSKNHFDRLLNKSISAREIIFFALVLLCLSPYMSPPIALLLGIGVAQFIGHPYLHLNNKATHILLQISVVGLGFGMNIQNALNAGKEGISFTVISILGTLILGFILGKIFRLDKKISYMISAGTAICGGSAIAAISPVIAAKENETSVALGVIFILNSVALFLFPFIGHQLHLSQTQFGIWCAIAIHDTSSVVGAASKYGTQALEIATTVKLARALWIIPVAIASTFLFKNKKAKLKIPYFIGLFILATLAVSYLDVAREYGHYIVDISKSGLTLTLFLIGCGLSGNVLRSVGAKPLLQGIILWCVISIGALAAVMNLLH